MVRVVQAMRVIAPELPFDIQCIELTQPEEQMEVCGYHITAFRVNHNVTCYGYSIEIKRGGKFDAARAKEQGIPLQCWNPLQKGQIVEADGKTYTPDMVLGPARKGIKPVSYTHLDVYKRQVRVLLLEIRSHHFLTEIFFCSIRMRDSQCVIKPHLRTCREVFRIAVFLIADPVSYTHLENGTAAPAVSEPEQNPVIHTVSGSTAEEEEKK